VVCGLLFESTGENIYVALNFGAVQTLNSPARAGECEIVLTMHSTRLRLICQNVRCTFAMPWMCDVFERFIQFGP